jgi:hypothetical protein
MSVLANCEGLIRVYSDGKKNKAGFASNPKVREKVSVFRFQNFQTPDT